MTLKVYKYPLTHEATPTIQIPSGYKILCFAYQADTPTVWALVNPDNDVEDVKFRLFGTGHEIEESPNTLEFIGTAMVGPYVFHLFRYRNIKWLS